MNPQNPPRAHVVSNSLTVAIDAPATVARQAVRRLDLAGPALRALEELGLDDRVTFRPGGMTWHQRRGTPIEVDVELRIEAGEDDASWLEITTRFSAADEHARVRLLDAWALVGPVASMLVERAARGVKAYAERDTFDGEEREGRHLRAA
jgi:hypothetical protein